MKDPQCLCCTDEVIRIIPPDIISSLGHRGEDKVIIFVVIFNLFIFSVTPLANVLFVIILIIICGVQNFATDGPTKVFSVILPMCRRSLCLHIIDPLLLFVPRRIGLLVLIIPGLKRCRCRRRRRVQRHTRAITGTRGPRRRVSHWN